MTLATLSGPYLVKHQELHGLMSSLDLHADVHQDASIWYTPDADIHVLLLGDAPGRVDAGRIIEVNSEYLDTFERASAIVKAIEARFRLTVDACAELQPYLMITRTPERTRKLVAAIEGLLLSSADFRAQVAREGFPGVDELKLRDFDRLYRYHCLLDDYAQGAAEEIVVAPIPRSAASVPNAHPYPAVAPQASGGAYPNVTPISAPILDDTGIPLTATSPAAPPPPRPAEPPTPTPAPPAPEPARQPTPPPAPDAPAGESADPTPRAREHRRIHPRLKTTAQLLGLNAEVDPALGQDPAAPERRRGRLDELFPDIPDDDAPGRPGTLFD
ncbi:hypothetical protein [Deinococcus soli (ex Cha et al. 2016)]|uniref:Uncharacterized protein n=2 Tax=Deinococcus soli (ex Cha et al. 2016) TaxID=1309411 RepID=A0AAE3XD08_9DEIO|nr:hypothetical protein [Deinococcus soli (ex Cha et al. 2016)]MDR6218966.1 hypothetical protein [Deinococcus soli (ex Cha et al. 2016)]MDR6328763.1 hypothetical protein [Deinococcus soli (ex Cha et al. 2016)]MDR6751750.1 hypothetical protein [Deinococcus soli (ex Cha et al. 2016)]